MKILRIGWLLGLMAPFFAIGQIKGTFDILSDNVTSHRSYNTMSQIVQSDDGSVIVGWRSARQGVPYNSIFMQKIDRFGKKIWEKDGTPLCPFSANQANFSMVSDGYGGIVVVWEDYRNGSELPAVYAQRVNLRGEPLWGKDGARICEGKAPQRKPRIISDKENGFFVVWEDARGGINESDLYAQHMDLGGRLRWMKSGMPICTSPNLQQNFSIAADEKHHLYIIWEDFRNGVYWNLFAQKLDKNGNFFWKAGGLDIFANVEENHQNPQLVPDGYGGILFVYQKYSGETHGTDIYRGRLQASGELLFHFATCYSQDEQLNPVIVKKGSKAILCWEDRRNGNWDLYAQMIRLNDGILEWDVNGVPVIKTEADERAPVVITSASYGYQVFSWLQKDGKDTRVFVQKLNNLGEPAWDEEGRPVCTYSKSQTEPSIWPDAEGGLWCSWTDRREASSAHIFVQHVNGLGRPLLRPQGSRMGAKHSQVWAKVKGLKMLAARTGHFFVVWEDYRSGDDDPDLYIQKLDPRGNAVWRRGGIPVCMAPGEQSGAVLVEDGVGGVIVVWGDRRSKRDEDIYAQRISAWGKMLWRSDGVLVCGANSDQSGIRAISDGKEGLVLCWVDARTLTETGFDLYIQRVGHDGEVLWRADGKPFARYPGLQTAPCLVSDDKGGAYISWMDARGEFSNIYVQHIDEFGIYEWEYGGRCPVPMSANQRNPAMVRNRTGDIFLVWQEGRYGDGFEKLFLQCITPNGRKLWDRYGIQVCKNAGRQSRAALVSDDFGNLWVSWLDERNTKYTGVQLRVQKYNSGGEMQWQNDGVKLGESMEEWNHYDFTIDGKSNIYAVWNQETASENRNVFCQMISEAGIKAFGYGGMRTGGESEHQISPTITVNQDGRVLVGWVQQVPSAGTYSIRAIFMPK